MQWKFRGKEDGRVRIRLRGELLIAILLCTMCVFAQEGMPEQRPASAGSVSGKVTSSTGQKDAEILAGIAVKLTSNAIGSAPRTTSTDFEGRFEFAHLTSGTFTLETGIAGFQPSTETINLGPNEILIRNIVLQITSVEQRIEVQGEAAEIATQSVSATATVTEQQLEDLPLQKQEFIEALAMSPNVIRTQEGKLNFNGQAESQGMLLVDSAENVDPVSGSFAIPIPVNSIQNIQVFSTPDSSLYGGFSGGLTRIDIRPPAPAWNYKFLNIVPSFRGKHGHLIGLLNMTPGVEFGGPLIKDKLNFSETMTYEYRKDPVHGLTWPWNETVTYSVVSFTAFQYTFSSKHVLNVNLNIFPATVLYANINALVPQSASTNIRRRGSSTGISDAYQFDSGAILTTFVRYTNFFNSERGQGLADMTINPEGWGGNYFNTFSRNGNQVEALPIVQMPVLSWLGTHQLQFGTDVLYRTFTGSSVSRPIQLLAQDGTVDETINFIGTGNLRSSDEEISGFAEDRWSFAKHMALTLGGRVTHQTEGRNAAFAPRLGLAYSTPNGKIAVRAGAGLIYGHVPLLASDFSGYQERMITLNPGTLSAQTYTLKNVFQSPTLAGNSSTLLDHNNSTRTFTWNAEAETSLHRNVTLRFGYYETRTSNLFVLNPILPSSGGPSGFMALVNSGRSNFEQAQVTARYRPSVRNEINVSYAWSRARGDLNTISDTFLPVQIPVVHPNVFGVRPSDIPNRVLTWGFITLPKKFVFSAVADVHTGFPYSNVDALQNYVGVPDSLRFPIYFAMDVKFSREFTVRMPFKENSKRKKINIGVFSQDVTDRRNPHDVYSNVTAPFPLFGQFAGFQRRLTGLDINLSE
jgi:hypothetical protein